MTLNLSIVSPKTVYQCSDFRLTYQDGTITDDEAQKIVPVVTPYWSALVQYTGVAKNTRNFDTSQWLGALPSQVEPETPLKWLKERLLKVGQRHIGVLEDHTFSAAGFEDGRPFFFVVSNFQSIDNNRLSSVSANRRKWRATGTTGRHGAFATGKAEYVNSAELGALTKVARTKTPTAVHRKLAELNQKAAQRAGTNGPISESCMTGRLSLAGNGDLVPHDVHPGGDYLPKFATDLLGGGRVRARMDGDGNPMPRRLAQIGIMRRDTVPFWAFLAEFQGEVEMAN